MPHINDLTAQLKTHIQAAHLARVRAYETPVPKDLTQDPHTRLGYAQTYANLALAEELAALRITMTIAHGENQARTAAKPAPRTARAYGENLPDDIPSFGGN